MAEEEGIADREPSRERPIKVSAWRRILEIRFSIDYRDLLINSSLFRRKSSNQRRQISISFGRKKKKKEKKLCRDVSRVY